MSAARSSSRPLRIRPPERPVTDIGMRDELPQSPAVLLLVDVINPLEFPEADQLAAPAWRAARATARLREEMTRRGCVTIYANDNYGRWRSHFRDTLGYCQAKDGIAGKIARLLTPTDNDLVMLKPRHSAFYATPLDLILTQVGAHGVVIAGLASDICVQLTAMDASLRGYRLWVPRDCTAAEQPEDQQAALRYMARVLKADVRSARHVAPVLAQLTQPVR